MFNRGKKGKKSRDDEYSSTKPRNEEFRAIIDKNTSCTLYDQLEKTLIIVKKDLIDYKLIVNSSEAPVKNFINNPQLEVANFEDVIAERAILDKEVFPLNDKIKTYFKSRDLKLRAIRLCVGREEDYVTINEKDLESVDVIPTISGLKAFVESHSRSIIGFSIRKFDAKKGNVTFLNTVLSDSTSEISMLKVRILASLQQRGFYMQKHHKAYGLQLYLTIKLEKPSGILSQRVIDFLKDINIPIESIYLKRNSSIQDWISLECEMDEKNLKNYIQAEYEFLAHSDVSLIAEFCFENKLSFDVAVKMAEMLNSMKMKKAKGDRKDGFLIILDPEDIAAAGKIAASYFGIKDLIISKDLNEKILLRSEKILNDFV